MTITLLLNLAGLCCQHTPLANFSWVTTEGELSRKIGQLAASDFPLLVVVTPSFSTLAPDADNVQHIAAQLFFILANGRFQNETQASLQADMDLTLSIAMAIKSFLINGFPNQPHCPFQGTVFPDSFNLDPEYNFLGCNGWSMSFQSKYF